MLVGFSSFAKGELLPTERRHFTLDEHFDEGLLDNVEHEIVHDQLQLSQDRRSLPFIWVPNNEGTIGQGQAQPVCSIIISMAPQGRFSGK